MKPKFRKYELHDVDSYINTSTQESQHHLKELRDIILSTVSGVEEKISWGVPFYRYHGLLAGFAAYTHHVGFGLITVLSQTTRQVLEQKGYKTGKKTVQIRFDQAVPKAIIQDIIKIQMVYNTTLKTKQPNQTLL